MTAGLAWCGTFDNAELNTLHARGFGGEPGDTDWWSRVNRHSLGWVCARSSGGRLVGFVNVAWDGGVHASLFDTVVDPDWQRAGLGRDLVSMAADRARAAGCDWLHVDFEPHLAKFYLESCGFDVTQAGLLRLGTVTARTTGPGPQAPHQTDHVRQLPTRR